jgi:hypothetical protein
MTKNDKADPPKDEKKEKQTVQYLISPYTNIVVGQRALVIPMDHPDTINVTNGVHAFTSEVIAYNSETGEFETRNSRYLPAVPEF